MCILKSINYIGKVRFMVSSNQQAFGVDMKMSIGLMFWCTPCIHHKTSIEVKRPVHPSIHICAPWLCACITCIYLIQQNRIFATPTINETTAPIIFAVHRAENGPVEKSAFDSSLHTQYPAPPADTLTYILSY